MNENERVSEEEEEEDDDKGRLVDKKGKERGQSLTSRARR